MLNPSPKISYIPDEICEELIASNENTFPHISDIIKALKNNEDFIKNISKNKDREEVRKSVFNGATYIHKRLKNTESSSYQSFIDNKQHEKIISRATAYISNHMEEITQYATASSPARL